MHFNFIIRKSSNTQYKTISNEFPLKHGSDLWVGFKFTHAHNMHIFAMQLLNSQNRSGIEIAIKFDLILDKLLCIFSIERFKYVHLFQARPKSAKQKSTVTKSSEIIIRHYYCYIKFFLLLFPIKKDETAL